MPCCDPAGLAALRPRRRPAPGPRAGRPPGRRRHSLRRRPRGRPRLAPLRPSGLETPPAETRSTRAPPRAGRARRRPRRRGHADARPVLARTARGASLGDLLSGASAGHDTPAGEHGVRRRDVLRTCGDPADGRPRRLGATLFQRWRRGPHGPGWTASRRPRSGLRPARRPARVPEHPVEGPRRVRGPSTRSGPPGARPSRRAPPPRGPSTPR